MSVRKPNLLVLESVTIDRLSTCPITVCSVTSLHHEPFDYSMELAILIVQSQSFTSIISCTNTSKVFTSFRKFLKQFKDNSFLDIILVTLVSNSYIKVNLTIRKVKLRKFLEKFSNFSLCLFIVNSTLEKLLHCCFL